MGQKAAGQGATDKRTTHNVSTFVAAIWTELPFCPFNSAHECPEPSCPTTRACAMPPSLLITTWSDGVFELSEHSSAHLFPGRSARGLCSDGAGGALAIIDNHRLMHRSRVGVWTELATDQH